MTYKDNKADLQATAEQLAGVRELVKSEGDELFTSWEPHIRRRSFAPSARNLAYYLALRRRDIRGLQERLYRFGLSSLGRSESKVLANLDAVLVNLESMTGRSYADVDYPAKADLDEGSELLATNAAEAMGKAPEDRSARIMVTLPTEAASDPSFVRGLLEAGMDIARINCAHDTAREWQAMIDHIREAERQIGRSCKVYIDIAGPKIRIARIFTTLQNPKLQAGDRFFLTGRTALESFYGLDLVVGCTNPEVIDKVEEGGTVLIDDGRIEGAVESRKEEGLIVCVEKVLKPGGVKVKVQKGLNFPDSAFQVEFLTAKDKRDLDFACERADIIGFSFVNSVDDVRYYQREMEARLGAEKAAARPVVVKMETVPGIENLPHIIAAAASVNPFGIMIARGDLAVEVGYLRLSELQEEILWICEAAHVPVCWSTQVLESLVKTGIPTRAEITDATMGGRAECVMLNKGPFLREGISMLSDILQKNVEHQNKKSSRMRKLQVAERAMEDVESEG